MTADGTSSATPNEGASSSSSDMMHWSISCPFCYVGQEWDAILEGYGLQGMHQPMRAHPDIPPGGHVIGPRIGPMYTFLEAEAARAGLPLQRPSRLPDTRMALGVAEWVRIQRPSAAHAFNEALFAAHFVRGEDIGDVEIVERYAAEAGVAGDDLRQAMTNGDTDALLFTSERNARRSGVSGTPAWQIRGRLISGLKPAEVFERLATAS